MSLRVFHKVFIASALILLGYLARWASGHNAANLATPWARDAALAGLVLLTPYFVWKVKNG